MMIRWLMALLLFFPVAVQGQVEVVWSTTGPEERPFVTVTSLLEVDGDVWVFDARGDYHAYVYSADGEFQRYRMRHGEGPGEVRGTARTARQPDGEGFASLSSGRISYLTNEGRYDGRVSLTGAGMRYPKDIALSGTKLFLAGGLYPNDLPRGTQSPHVVAVYDKASGEYLYSFAERVPGVAHTESGGAMDVSGNRLIYAHATPYRIEEYRVDTGELRRTIATDTILSPYGKDYYYKLDEWPETRFDHAQFPRTFFVKRVPGNRLLVSTRFSPRDRAGDSEEDGFRDPRTIFDLYDLESGERLSRWEVDEAYEVFDMASNGDLLVRFSNRLNEYGVARLRLTGL